MKRSWLLGLCLLAAVPATGHGLDSTDQAGLADPQQTAYAFLEAWTGRDVQAGFDLLSPRLWSEIQADSTKGEGWFYMYMTGLSNPHHETFELGTGQVEDSTRFVFPVVLIEGIWGDSTKYRYESTMELLRDSTAWRVDRLPKDEHR